MRQHLRLPLLFPHLPIDDGSVSGPKRLLRGPAAGNRQGDADDEAGAAAAQPQDRGGNLLVRAESADGKRLDRCIEVEIAFIYARSSATTFRLLRAGG